MIAGVYGDVVRVKILYNKRDSALIQFKEPQHAQTGMLDSSIVLLLLLCSQNTHHQLSYCQLEWSCFIW